MITSTSRAWSEHGAIGMLGCRAMKPRCPTCKKRLPEPPPATFPFCGASCKLADLGSWLDGKYVVASPGFDDGSNAREDSDAENFN